MDFYDGAQTPVDPNSVGFSRTLQGLSLMAVGTALLWIPYLVYVGELLNFIGIILIFLGRGAFQPSHGTYVALSIVIYFVTFVILIAIVLGSVSGIVNALMGSAPQSVKMTEVTSWFRATFEAGIVLAIISMISFVLFSWKINDSTGRLLLLIGYVTSVVIAIVVGLAAMNFASSALANLINGASAQTVINQINSRKTFYSLFYGIPYVIFAFTYYRTRSVISNLPPDVSPV